MVTFKNEDKAVDEADVEAACPVDNGNGLSKSSRAWDLDGDGELDEAELALKNMDKGKKGELSKDEMYQLMRENLKTQHSLFKMKKIVMALVAITCVLALANMGTSFAAAILSKDVKSTQGALVDKASGKTLKTDSWTNIVTEDKAATEERRRRKMQECQTETDEGESDEHLSCVFHDHLISKADGLSLLAECMSGGDVDIHFKHEEHEIAHLESHCICGEGHDAVYDLDENNVPISATITAGDHTYIVQPDTEQPDIYYDVVLDTPIPGN